MIRNQLYLMFFHLALVIAPYTAVASAPEYPDRLAVPEFSVPRGHYQQPFDLVISATTPGASIVYTIDGSEPSLDPPVGHHETGASLSLHISRTMSVRAMVVVEGYKPSMVETHSFVFPTEILQQGTPPHPFKDWGHSGPDWEVDQDIVRHKDAESRLTPEDLLSIPALYLSIPFDELWGDGGIYIAGEGDPRHCSVELLNPGADNGSPNRLPGLQMDATVQITGGSSTQRWKTDKLSMRLKFHHEVEFPVFEHAPRVAGHEPTRSFHTLVLDARLNESWNHPSGSQRAQGQYVRDQYIADLQNATGGTAPHGRHVHLYLAGVYWGLYNLHERPDEHFVSRYLGGKPADYDVIKHNVEDVVSGGNDNFKKLNSLIYRSDIDSAETYARVGEMLDLEDFARYILLNQWAGNTDWSHQNWYASLNRADPDGRWRFHAWDAELTLKDVSEDVTSKDEESSPTGFHQRLLRNDAYRALFTDTVRAAKLGGGLLDPAFSAGLYRQRIAEVNAAIRAESARWGDNRRRRPYTRGKEWLEERDRILESHIPRRTEVLLGQFRDAGWLP